MWKKCENITFKDTQDQCLCSLFTLQELQKFLPKITRSIISVPHFSIGVYEKKYF